MSKVGFLRRRDTIDFLRVVWKLPELRDKLMIFVIVGMRTEEHSLRSHVGIGSESILFARTAGEDHGYFRFSSRPKR